MIWLPLRCQVQPQLLSQAIPTQVWHVNPRFPQPSGSGAFVRSHTSALVYIGAGSSSSHCRLFQSPQLNFDPWLLGHPDHQSGSLWGRLWAPSSWQVSGLVVAIFYYWKYPNQFLMRYPDSRPPYLMLASSRFWGFFFFLNTNCRLPTLFPTWCREDSLQVMGLAGQ